MNVAKTPVNPLIYNWALYICRLCACMYVCRMKVAWKKVKSFNLSIWHAYLLQWFSKRHPVDLKFVWICLHRTFRHSTYFSVVLFLSTSINFARKKEQELMIELSFCFCIHCFKQVCNCSWCICGTCNPIRHVNTVFALTFSMERICHFFSASIHTLCGLVVRWWFFIQM